MWLNIEDKLVNLNNVTDICINKDNIRIEFYFVGGDPTILKFATINKMMEVACHIEFEISKRGDVIRV